ncbi:hypothetical protein BJX63DRAFT_421030 [Aspergillus granulosus]|uniref:Leucine-rich repeat domain-containing protein n=1 Tax=Aspergillus granulosus TaxID=176169 RepID=A0ABR4HF95_9EURO
MDLLQVCRDWRSILFKRLYSSAHVSTHRLRRLIETALSNPKIAGTIRDVFIYKSFALYLDDQPTLSTALQDLVNQLSKSSEEAEKWFLDLEEHRDGAWIALLFTVLPNVAILKGNLKYSKWRFESLQLKIEDWKDYVHSYELTPFLHLPSICSMDVEGVNDHDQPDDNENHLALHAAPATSLLKVLKLDRNCNSRYGMLNFMNSCASLKQFTYAHNDLVYLGQWYSKFRPRKFRGPLLAQRQSLEVLHLMDDFLSSGVDKSDTDGPWSRWFGSLALFESLTDLCLPVQNLLPFHPKDRNQSLSSLKDILPRSLIVLRAAYCQERHCDLLVQNLKDLLYSCNEQVPNLKRVEVYSALAESSLPPPDRLYLRHPVWNTTSVAKSISEKLDPLREHFRQAGVEFGISLKGSYEIKFMG